MALTEGGSVAGGVSGASEVGLAAGCSWHGVIYAPIAYLASLCIGGGGGPSYAAFLRDIPIPWETPLSPPTVILGLAVGAVTLALAGVGFVAPSGRAKAAAGAGIVAAQVALLILIGSVYYFGGIVGILGGALLIAGSRGAGKRPATEAAS